MSQMNNIENELYNKILREILKRQREIIGPLAITQAKTVKGINISGDEVDIIEGVDQKKVLSNLVIAYSNIFGNVSIEVCKDAVKNISGVTKKDLPNILTD